MVEESKWMAQTREDPTRSTWYVERFRKMAAEGQDLAGEARLIDAMVARASRILDAGCGPGRVGGYLSTVGHVVVGVDVDPVLIAAAERDHPGPTWLVGDLAELDLPRRGVKDGFDAIVSAGNVMTFLAPSTRVAVLTRLAGHLHEEGRIVIGFGLDRDYELDEFVTDVATAELRFDSRFSTWDLRPFTEESSFIVAVLSPK
ncbi:MAG: class I SAM-dependent methyltransferase [Acidimicrobiales bacterium]